MVDIMSHVLEQYFHHGTNTELQDRYCESVLRTVIETAPKLLHDLENYEYRDHFILHDGVKRHFSDGCKRDWATHNIEHAVSAVHDIPHGVALRFYSRTG